MGRRIDRVADAYLAAPWVDWLLAGALAATLAVSSPAGLHAFVTRAQPDIALGLSALAGILLAAVVFACSMAFGSRASAMIVIRATRPRQHAWTWLSTISAELVAAVLPLLALLVFPAAPAVATALLTSSLVLILLPGTRMIWWLGTILLGDASDREHRMNATTKLPPKVSPGGA